MTSFLCGDGQVPRSLPKNGLSSGPGEGASLTDATPAVDTAGRPSCQPGSLQNPLPALMWPQCGPGSVGKPRCPIRGAPGFQLFVPDCLPRDCFHSAGICALYRTETAMAVLNLPVEEGRTVRMASSVVGSEGVVSLSVSSGNPLLVQPGNPNVLSCRLLLPCVKGQRKDVGIRRRQKQADF